MDTRLTRHAAVDGILTWLATHRRWLAAVAVMLVALLGFEALRAVLAEVRLKDVRAAVRAISTMRIALALGLTVASYLALTLYDHLVLRTIGAKLPWRTAALASFTSYTISHNLGLSFLTGGSVRYRVYSSAGLELGDVARISLLASAAFWGGVLVIAAVALALGAVPLAIGPATISPLAQHLAALAIFAVVAVVFVARGRGVATVGLGRLSLPIPPVGTMIAQLGVAAADLAFAAAALFVLLPGATPHAFGLFLIAYALAVIVTLLTHVPGGLGVFEAVILGIVPGNRGEIFAALLLYRFIYYLVPLAFAGGLLGIIEGYRLRRRIAIGLSLVDRVSRALTPSLLALMVATGGFILLVSGALPAVHSRMAWLSDVVPLPFVEASHFSASLVGTALLLVAPAINARLRTGFHAARLLLIGGAIFSLLKGVDYEEALVLAVIAAILQYCRPAFHRRGGVIDAPLQQTWLAVAAVVVALSLWAGSFAYKHVDYSNDLWWVFAWGKNAPRFLRASFGAVMLLAGLAAWRLLWAPVRPQGLADLPSDVADRAMAVAPRSDVALAFAGDKLFRVSRARDAFLMYRVQRRTWVVMGDPVGPLAAWPELVWAIRSACDEARGRLCFYQASDEMLPLLVELGLQVMKYGEEAHVDLARFTIEGAQGAKLRHSVRRCEGAGLKFEIVPRADLPAIIAALEAVSDAWLIGKRGSEKGFSIGRFDSAYLAHFDIAVLRREGCIVAFANLWESGDGCELSVDMMRHFPDAPNGTMDYLFVSLLQWGFVHGYSRFNLGMAPLSGLSGERLAPLWSRIGNAIYGHAEQLYGFSGLRSFKAKFRPHWVPRYVATPSGLAAPRSIVDLVALVGS
ncbi:MAG: bifunctional lysylphosphatidylglycerol flippase/synthetase MprF [Sphingomicrobium sp.]